MGQGKQHYFDQYKNKQEYLPFDFPIKSTLPNEILGVVTRILLLNILKNTININFRFLNGLQEKTLNYDETYEQFCQENVKSWRLLVSWSNNKIHRVFLNLSMVSNAFPYSTEPQRFL